MNSLFEFCSAFLYCSTSFGYWLCKQLYHLRVQNLRFSPLDLHWNKLHEFKLVTSLFYAYYSKIVGDLFYNNVYFSINLSLKGLALIHTAFSKPFSVIPQKKTCNSRQVSNHELHCNTLTMVQVEIGFSLTKPACNSK